MDHSSESADFQAAAPRFHCSLHFLFDVMRTRHTRNSLSLGLHLRFQQLPKPSEFRGNVDGLRERRSSGSHETCKGGDLGLDPALIGRVICSLHLSLLTTTPLNKFPTLAPSAVPYYGCLVCTCFPLLSSADRRTLSKPPVDSWKMQPTTRKQ